MYAAAWGTATARRCAARGHPSLAEETADDDERVSALAGVAAGDGEVAYFRLGAGGVRELVRRTPTGGAMVLAHDVLVADWNGKDFAVVRQVGAQLQLEYPMGRVLDKLARVRSIRISPDGTRVASPSTP